MQGNLRRAIESDIDNTGAGTRGSVALQIVVGPCAAAVRARATGIAHDGKPARQTDLATMGMPAKHDVEISMGRMPVDFR